MRCILIYLGSPYNKIPHQELREWDLGIFILNCPYIVQTVSVRKMVSVHLGISTVELWDIQLSCWFPVVLSLALPGIVPRYGKSVFMDSFKPYRWNKYLPDTLYYGVGGRVALRVHGSNPSPPWVSLGTLQEPPDLAGPRAPQSHCRGHYVPLLAAVRVDNIYAWGLASCSVTKITSPANNVIYIFILC